MLFNVLSRNVILGAVVALASFSARAADDEGQFGHVVGKDLELVYRHHALSGSIAETLIFSSPLEEEFGNQIYARFGESTVPMILKKDGAEVKLNATYKDAEGVDKTIAMAVNKIDGQSGKIHMTINQKAYVVQVSSEQMDGNHYVNPKFEVSKDGQVVYSFKLDNGAACIMCSTRISAVVLTFLEHMGKL